MLGRWFFSQYLISVYLISALPKLHFYCDNTFLTSPEETGLYQKDRSMSWGPRRPCCFTLDFQGYRGGLHVSLVLHNDPLQPTRDSWSLLLPITACLPVLSTWGHGSSLCGPPHSRMHVYTFRFPRARAIYQESWVPVSGAPGGLGAPGQERQLLRAERKGGWRR